MGVHLLDNIDLKIHAGEIVGIAGVSGNGQQELLAALSGILLASRLNGFEKADPKQLYRRFVEAAGTLTIQADRLTVTFDRRSHNPILREAALGRDSLPIAWLGRRTIEFAYH